MFGLDVNAFEIIARTIIIYGALLIALRAAGKRELGQMTPFDLVVLLLISEAVQNALKYSRAHQISIRLIGSTRRLALTVADDGVGFDVDAAWGRGLGLISMGERLETIDGTFAIRSTPGAGTTVEVVVPLHPTEDTVSV